MSRYSLNKKCKKCGSKLLDNNKTGFCNIHRDRTGKNNSFYGKKHDRKMIENTKKVLSIISKRLWKEPEYRKKVIKGVSKPRRKGFGEEQSVRITQWYKDNPIQIDIRSKAMRKSWENGNIIKNNYSCNDSKIEKDLFKEIKKIAPIAKEKQILRDSSNRWIFPDILIESYGIIIEFFGDFWHANPEIYKTNNIIHNNITAKQIWQKDKERIQKLQNMPDDNPNFLKEYNTIIVWERDYRNNKKQVLQEISQRLDYEYSY